MDEVRATFRSRASASSPSIARQVRPSGCWTSRAPWPPLVHDGTVFLAASDELHALDAATGNHRWRVPLGRGAMAPMAMVEACADRSRRARRGVGVPSVGRRASLGPGTRWTRGTRVNGCRMLPGYSWRCGSPRPRRVADGAVRWDRALPGQLTSTAVARDRVFVGSTTNEIFAFDAGQRIARVEVPVWRRRDWHRGHRRSRLRGLARQRPSGAQANNGNQLWKRALHHSPGRTAAHLRRSRGCCGRGVRGDVRQPDRDADRQVRRAESAPGTAAGRSNAGAVRRVHRGRHARRPGDRTSA